MFYQYEKRMRELHRVTQIKDPAEKEKALNEFINKELEILSGLDGHPSRSQALDSARCSLYTLKHQDSGFIPEELSI